MAGMNFGYIWNLTGEKKKKYEKETMEKVKEDSVVYCFKSIFQ